MARDLITTGAGAHEILFSSEGKAAPGGWSKCKAALDLKMLELARAERGEDFEIPDWRIHDLRRTFSTGMNQLGIQPHVVESCLNHISGHKGGVAGVYNKYTYLPEKTKALRDWALHVAALVEGRQENVRLRVVG
jgi:integrase